MEARDHRRRRVGTKVCLAPTYGVDEDVDRGAHVMRARGGTETGYSDADRFKAITRVFTEAARSKKNRDDNWDNRWKQWGNRGLGELTDVGDVEMPYARAREE